MATSIKWTCVPVLLAASLFACCAARYEPFLDLIVCLGATVFIQRAVRARQYVWAAGVAAVAIAFTPLSLILKAFLLIALLSLTIFFNLWAAFRHAAVFADPN